VIEKRKIHIPDEFHGMLRCPNPNCVTNKEGVTTHFVREGEGSKPVVRCTYCERVYKQPADLVE
jgi:aspartate carbamoyltransferase regulatory subunit